MIERSPALLRATWALAFATAALTAPDLAQAQAQAPVLADGATPSATGPIAPTPIAPTTPIDLNQIELTRAVLNALQNDPASLVSGAFSDSELTALLGSLTPEQIQALVENVTPTTLAALTDAVLAQDPSLAGEIAAGVSEFGSPAQAQAVANQILAVLQTADPSTPAAQIVGLTTAAIQLDNDLVDDVVNFVSTSTTPQQATEVRQGLLDIVSIAASTGNPNDLTTGSLVAAAVALNGAVPAGSIDLDADTAILEQVLSSDDSALNEILSFVSPDTPFTTEQIAALGESLGRVAAQTEDVGLASEIQTQVVLLSDTVQATALTESFDAALAEDPTAAVPPAAAPPAAAPPAAAPPAVGGGAATAGGTDATDGGEGAGAAQGSGNAGGGFGGGGGGNAGGGGGGNADVSETG